MQERVFDIEADGLNPTKIHCLGMSAGDPERVKTTVDYNDIAKMFNRTDIAIIAHNCVSYDVPVIERLVGVDVKCKIVDTLWLSWYLYPNRPKHGLADWGEYFGVPKPVVEDWENLPIEVYIERVTEDVRINTLLWNKMRDDLLSIYETEEEMWRFIDYITFKAQCVADQERLRWKLDVSRTEAMVEKLTKIKDDSFNELQRVMPKVPVYKKRKRPAKPYKMNGELSAHGESWFDLLKQEGLPEWTAEVKYIADYKEPNAGSVPQLKDWLYSLGWEPQTFEFKRNKETNETKQIPQIGIKNSGGDICDSVKLLFKKEPNLKILEGLSIVKHRLGLFNGFLRDHEDGWLRASAGGLTNTLRLKHRELVNLPGVDKLYGADIRGCLIAPQGYSLCGSDQAALEDRTKQHYMWDYDPEYVKKMMEEGYCPHVDIAVLAGYLDQEQERRHSKGEFIDKADEKIIKAGRKKAKPVNYGGVYGQQPKGLAQTTGMPLSQAQKLYDIYWERNWSVNAIAEACEVKTVSGQMWLKNPVSGFWYSLRYEKDRFSTLNQGTGVYCFDMWVMEIRKRGEIPIGQFHDEVIILTKHGDEDHVADVLRQSIKAVNNKLKLNRDLDVDVQFGKNYAEIH